VGGKLKQLSLSKATNFIKAEGGISKFTEVYNHFLFNSFMFI